MAPARWSLEALADVSRILVYIDTYSEAHSRIVMKRIQQAVVQLDGFVRMGRVVPEYKDESVREVVVSPYRILYRVVSEESVGIIGVIHSRRDLLALYGDQVPEGTFNSES